MLEDACVDDRETTCAGASGGPMETREPKLDVVTIAEPDPKPELVDIGGEGEFD